MSQILVDLLAERIRPTTGRGKLRLVPQGKTDPASPFEVSPLSDLLKLKILRPQPERLVVGLRTYLKSSMHEKGTLLDKTAK